MCSASRRGTGRTSSRTGNAYDALACLFGVRNPFGFRPLAEGRGLPEDASDGLRDAFNAWGGPQDAHATTWISWAEPARETVRVATGLDEDGDGKNNRVAVDIVRPGEPAAKGRKMPVTATPVIRVPRARRPTGPTAPPG